MARTRLDWLRAATEPAPWAYRALACYFAVALLVVAATARPVQVGLGDNTATRRLHHIEDEDPALADWWWGRSHDTWDFQTVGGIAWDDWLDRCHCSYGDFYHSFRTKVEGDVGGMDDTALNAVEFDCDGRSKSCSSHDGVVYGFYGSWSGWKTCPDGSHIMGVQLKVEAPQGGGIDDTSVNGVRVKCSDSKRTVLETSNTMKYGEWRAWRECPAGHAMCKYVLRVSPNQLPGGDDVGMNDMKFHCCKLKGTVTRAGVQVVNKMGVPIKNVRVLHRYNGKTPISVGLRDEQVSNGAHTGTRSVLNVTLYARFKYTNEWALAWTPVGVWHDGLTCVTQPTDVWKDLGKTFLKLANAVGGLGGLGGVSSISSLSKQVVIDTSGAVLSQIGDHAAPNSNVSLSVTDLNKLMHAPIWAPRSVYPMDDYIKHPGSFVQMTIGEGKCYYFLCAICPQPRDADYPDTCDNKFRGKAYMSGSGPPDGVIATGDLVISTPRSNGKTTVEYQCSYL